LKKLALAFLTACVFVPNFPEKLHITTVPSKLIIKLEALGINPALCN
jgi:hypothetical protein